MTAAAIDTMIITVINYRTGYNIIYYTEKRKIYMDI